MFRFFSSMCKDVLVNYYYIIILPQILWLKIKLFFFFFKSHHSCGSEVGVRINWVFCLRVKQGCNHDIGQGCCLI